MTSRVTSLLVLAALGLANSLRAQTPLPRLAVSANHRFLVTADSAAGATPFFWLGDTVWELFHRAGREEAERFLQDRAHNGFTVIQAVALAEFDGLTVPNAYGELPLLDHDPARPNEAYFAHVDWVVRRANALGMYVGFLPTWGEKWNRKWGVGPEIFTPENAERYGAWLGRRYKDDGIIWILGGDRPVETERHRAILSAMARGLRAGDGGAHLITMHPAGGEGSSTWFHDSTWLDFNMRQNGHGTDFGSNYQKTATDYARTPAKPVLDGEPVYEDHPIAFEAPKLGHSIAADVRRALYWDLFSGAFGHTYGHHSVWQLWKPGREPVNNPLLPWYDAVAQPGARQMHHARDLLLSRPFLTRIPAEDVVVPDAVPTSVPGAGRYRFVATRDSARTYAMVYAPIGRPFRVRMSVIAGAVVKAWWFNPRTGEATEIGVFPSSGEREFVSPDPGEAIDWVLVLDDVGKSYPAPGKTK